MYTAFLRMAHSSPGLRRCEFEVFGKVQGVFFRKYARQFAKDVGLVGWVQNTESGTVRGTCEGNADSVDKFKKWLSYTGSPKSRIDRCEIRVDTPVSRTEYSDFVIRR
ncbi:unnamed protein product [Calicophoron daubneyi]|uniref:Acylphosphatase n=1 Tax=Calicophoron daubneyi TaxID=300641 RepID=A0AAV2T0Q4_CALDB